MTIKAIPTKYEGLQFRSRLEATWAAFFDLMKWDWEYEPCDFPGWIPDFIVGRDPYEYIEVKPWRAASEIKREPAWEGQPVVICGIAPLMTESAIGVSVGWRPDGVEVFAGKGCVLKYAGTEHYKMLHAWRKAKNKTQWRAPK